MTLSVFVVPSDNIYTCSGCKATGRKLWRRGGKITEPPVCATCAQKVHGKVSLDAEGRSYSTLAKAVVDCIGPLVPYIPKVGEHRDHYHTSEVPPDGWVWWRKLPN